MRHKRELLWWLLACAAAVGLSVVVGGFIGPIVTLFVLVALAGAILIEFEGPQAVAADGDDLADYVDDELPAPAADPEAPAVASDSGAERPTDEQTRDADGDNEDSAAVSQDDAVADEPVVAEEPALDDESAPQDDAEVDARVSA